MQMSKKALMSKRVYCLKYLSPSSALIPSFLHLILRRLKKKKIGSIFFLKKCKEKKRKEEKNILGLLTHWAWDTLKGNNSRIIQSFMKSPHIVGNKNLFGHWNLLPGVPLITEEGYQQ